jgi:hypothetical protein
MRFPPGLLGPAIVQSAMVQVAEWHRPLVADLASERPRLGKADIGRAEADFPASDRRALASWRLIWRKLRQFEPFALDLGDRIASN